jgi:RNA polymerase sigma factor (sigma-70 family)
MAETLNTRPSLLVRLRDARDDTAWRQFVALYGPAILRFTRQRGLQDADAADVQQNVLAAVNQGLGNFDAAKGSFRGWLFGIVRHQLRRLLDKHAKAGRAEGDTAALERLQDVPAPADDAESALWNQECKRQRFLWACDQVRGQVEPASWQAFWRTAVDNRPAADVAAELHMRVGAVYTAKSRVLARIRALIQELADDR